MAKLVPLARSPVPKAGQISWSASREHRRVPSYSHYGHSSSQSARPPGRGVGDRQLVTKPFASVRRLTSGLAMSATGSTADVTNTVKNVRFLGGVDRK